MTTDRDGNENSAYDFDSYLETIELPYQVVNNLSNITTSFWMKTTNDSHMGIISGANTAYDNEFIIMVLEGNIAPYIKGSYFSSPTYILDNDWHNISITRNSVSGLNKIYIDGIYDSEQALLTGIINISQGGLWLGCEQDEVGGSWDPEQQFIGKLDDVRIYNRVLSDTEIEDIYIGFDANFICPETSYIGEQIQFTDTSTGSPTTWEWDFENDGIYDLTYYSYQDTIYWTYENTEVDSVKLKISNGTFVDSLTKAISVLYCPPAPPDSVQLILNYPDVTISWTAVDTTICGSSITPDYYVIQYSETSQNEDFYYLNYVLPPITEFTHTGVLMFGNNGEPSDHMFYKVITIKNYNREQIEYLESLNNSTERIKWSDVKRNLETKK